jgi:hypothetical protein
MLFPLRLDRRRPQLRNWPSEIGCRPSTADGPALAGHSLPGRSARVLELCRPPDRPPFTPDTRRLIIPAMTSRSDRQDADGDGERERNTRR